MPTISLRMTEEQIEELREWARQGHRSLQKEIIWRLFSVEAIGAPKYGPATEKKREEIKVPPDGTEAGLPEREEENPQVQEEAAAPLKDSTPSRSVNPEPKKRMYPCKHHLPPSKHCPYGCDDV